MSDDDEKNAFTSVFRDSVLLRTLLEKIVKDSSAGVSQQSISPGEKPQPFDMREALKFKLSNVHHSRCIKAKVASTVGLGFYDDMIAEELDPLCRSSGSWQETLNDVDEDCWDLGNGYLEIVREAPNGAAPIVGIHHVPAAEVRIVIEDVRYNMHYLASGNREGGDQRLFAKFGDLDDFLSGDRKGAAFLGSSAEQRAERKVAELIHFRTPSSLSRFYGFPDHLCAVQSIELRQALSQHNYDFFNNRGVPEFMLFILGQKLAKEDWDKVQSALKNHIGLGNAWKSTALNIPNKETVVQVEKLALEGKSDAAVFSNMADTLALEIVSAHGVPPLLAGIALPGKMAATNELPNALMAFQTLVIGQAQRLRENTLAMTLGDKARNGGLTLRRKNLLGRFQVDPTTGKRKKVAGLRTILDDIDIGAMDTVARMKEPIAGSGRDPAEGLKD